ncbi:MAG: hypothetical protein GYB15_04250 [Gammaproteobacteria bacterium]|uniref:Uncharacterized protein n=1 Tax=Vreelandella titanicae TaxID=664683 RepID=A0A558JA92_9GAMM|nr:hypothetical protein [Halomonas titanicae]MBR9903110.1 hypothetical protein [Gammaproteobacteria bacterium]TVU90558.1 hypothetical protein FQP89_05500 [Halomonas titanicae]
MVDNFIETAVKQCEKNRDVHNKRGGFLFLGAYAWVAFLAFVVSVFMSRSTYIIDIVITLTLLWTSIFFIIIGLYRMHIRLAEKQQLYIVGFMRTQVSIAGLDSHLHEPIAKALSESAFTDPESAPKGQRNNKGIAEGHPINDATMTVFNRLMDSVELQIKQNKNETKQ